MDLGVNLDPAVFWDHCLWDLDSLVDGDALADDSVMFHAARSQLLNVDAIADDLL